MGQGRRFVFVVVALLGLTCLAAPALAQQGTSGIAGLVTHNSEMPEAELARRARSMADAIAYRGPDGSGVWAGEGTAAIPFGAKPQSGMNEPSPKQPLEF